MRQKLTNIETQDPHLKYLISKINSDFDNNNDACMSDEFVETNAVKIGRMFYPEAEFFNRHLINGVYFDSPCYKRSKIGNCFVSFVRDNVEFYGQILYFIKISGPPYFGEVQANVNLFEIVEEIGPVKGFFFRVRSTDHEKIVALPLLKKIFLFTDFSKNKDLSQTEKFIVKLCSSFEHS